jgi:subtilisin
VRLGLRRGLFVTLIMALVGLALADGVRAGPHAAQTRDRVGQPEPGVLEQRGNRPPDAPGPQAGAAVPDEYIVVLRPEPADPRERASQMAVQHELAVTRVYERAVRGFAARIPPQRLAAVRADPRVLFISENRRVQAFSQQAPAGLRRIGASSDGVHQTMAFKGTGVGVAVIDTGIDLTHPDLAPVQNGITCISGTANANDDQGHGTHVAGTVAARDNDIGVVGVAPDVTLYAVKVLDSTGNGDYASVICGVDWVTANAGPVGTPGKIQVANVSLGGPGTATPSNPDCTNASNDALHFAICNSVQAGITYVVAAGNSHADASGFLPAAFEEVITVSAFTDFNGSPGGGAGFTCFDGLFETDDSFASFSNYGAPVDIAAPGTCILSTWPGGGYFTTNGTSMASPHVAGAAALYKQANPAASPAQVMAGLLAQQEPGPIPGDPDPSKEGRLRVATTPIGTPTITLTPTITRTPTVTPTPAPVVLRADYQVQNSRASTVAGAPDLADVGTGGAATFQADTVGGTPRTVLRFPLHTGLAVSPSTVVPNGGYSVVALFKLDVVSGYKRVLDFKNGTADYGLYVQNGKLYFFPSGTGPTAVVPAGGYVQVVLTRDAASEQVVGYVNGAQQFSFTDTSDHGVISAANALRLFKDDLNTEESAGSLARLRLYDGPLTASQVAALQWLPGGPPGNPPTPTATTTGTATPTRTPTATPTVTPTPAPVVLRADYQVQNSRGSVVVGAPDLADLGSGGPTTFQSDSVNSSTRTVLRFPLHSGLAVSPSTVVPNGGYSIVALIKLDVVSGYKRVLDFKNGTADYGLYVQNGKLYFYPAATGSAAVVPAATYVQVVLTRNAASKQVVGYVNGAQQFSFTDTSDHGVISAANALRLFKDDLNTEESAGSLARLRLYDGPLTASQVAALEWLPNP